ncbi:MAG: phosphoribosyltransferase [Myxococcota bacterium]
MATRKKTARVTKGKKAASKKPAAKRVVKKVAAREAPLDEFSAAGGMPFVPVGLPANDYSRRRESARELSWGEFDRRVQELARAASRTFRPDAVVGLVHGGVFVGGALASALKAEFFPVRITRRSRDAGVIERASDDFPTQLQGRRVLLVDDVASSGDTLDFASRLARNAGATGVKTATLIARPGRYQPDFIGVESDDFFVFPWDYEDVVADRRFDTGELPAAPGAARKKA